MAFGNGYTVAFAAGICVVCSIALAGVSKGLAPMQEANQLQDQQRKVLQALGLPDTDVEATYTSRVKVLVVDGEGALVTEKTLDDVRKAREGEAGGRFSLENWVLPAETTAAPGLYAIFQRVSEDGKTVERLALEMHGRGLWGPVSAYIALDPTGKTIEGATFSGPKETPGLGAEIMADWFQDQWKGKTLLGDGKTVRVVKGKAAVMCSGNENQYCVDGVSGATLTSNGVTDMLAKYGEYYKPYLQKLGGT